MNRRVTDADTPLPWQNDTYTPEIPCEELIHIAMIGLRKMDYTFSVHHDYRICQQTRVDRTHWRRQDSTMVELGVYEGEFSDHYRRILAPDRLPLFTRAHSTR